MGVVGEGTRASPAPGAAWYTNWLATWTLAVLLFVGRIRDLLWRGRPRPPKGYAPLTDPQSSFYARRIYGRIHDCWNRPIASAPGPWVDVLERESLEGRTRATRALPPTGARRRCLNLGSYNYLGFAASDPYCTPRVLGALSAGGVSPCASRACGGALPVHSELEAMVAEFVGAEDAIAYGMGFATNSASLPVLCGPGALVLSDALNHTSIVAGVRSGGAAVRVFRHNDMRHLEALLRYHIAEGQPRTHRPWKKILIVVEGTYSMEGESPPLAAIVSLKKRYGAYLYLDEAHSIGAMGGTGRGLCEHAGVDPRDVDVLMGTFTKSFGSAGGYVAGSRAVIAYLRRHSPAHLYAAALAPGAAAQVVAALRLMRGEGGGGRGAAKVAQLHGNAHYMRRRLIAMGLHVLGDWDSPVVPVMVYHVGLLGAISRALLRRRVAAVVVGFPATPLLLCRLRICVSAAHSREDLDYALDAIRDVAEVAGIDYARPAGRLWGLRAAARRAAAAAAAALARGGAGGAEGGGHGGGGGTRSASGGGSGAGSWRGSSSSCCSGSASGGEAESEELSAAAADAHSCASSTAGAECCCDEAACACAGARAASC
ncbi:long chain base biosynthesis [Raphidocelis subcapitata]|uniref:serine C-palmitoyltransferase n=1 Tax=Raphidocelis subcapitata TaxID=307507 RepID=A0A2V0PER5_9CHLO|nr:long chain base biosynthesis [Raphidocelis subcapitata]|eukprot:GBF98009.1 long chain base biosynthesis [Raphidocelis subcapitata]